MSEVKKLSQQTIVIIFVAVSIIAGGAGYATLKINDATATSSKLTVELANLHKEKVVALDMLKERDEELSMYKTTSEKHKEDVEKLTDVMEKQKSAAKKLAELLAKTQKERDSFKSEKEALSRPDSLPCIEALQAKDTAIGALLGERQMADKTMTALKYQAKKEESKRDALAAQLNEREVELDQLHTWKESATLELKNLQQGARSAAIWAAAVDERTKDSCPEPVPPILKVEDLGQLAQTEKLKVGAEIGCGSGHSKALLSRWPLVSKLRCFAIPRLAAPSEGNETAPEAEAEDFLGQLENVYGSKVEVVQGFGKAEAAAMPAKELDLVHLALDYDHPVYDKEELVETLELVWRGMKPNGLIVGGLVKSGATVDRQRKLVALNTIEAFARQKHRQMAKYGTGTWAIRR